MRVDSQKSINRILNTCSEARVLFISCLEKTNF
jgi:hypothetical protein